jgi:Tfp pilus assembly protein PilV
MKINKLIKGQSMFEVLVAIFIITLITVGVVVVSTTSVANSTFSRNSTLAGRYAQEAIEWIRDEKSTNITLFKTRIPQSIFCLDNLAWTNTNVCGAAEYVNGSNSVFKREVRLTSSQISGKTIIQADVKVYWVDSKGTHEVSSSTNFSDIREK